MKQSVVMLIVLALAVPALALDTGNARPEKPAAFHQTPVGEPDRQGGDLIADAVPITIPNYEDITGSTVGYNDDYDEVCPYSQSTSPDVVYSFSVSWPLGIDIDMFGSTYDTKIYVYDENLTLVACNDDWYSDYVSRIEYLELEANVTYYLVIDGYGGDAGDYVLHIYEWMGEYIECPDGAELEGEPELVDGYQDAHNGGCNSPEFGNPFGTITQQIFCGVSGWYLSADGSNYRDTDWFEIVVPNDGFVEIVGDAEWATYMFELGPQDCGSVGVIQNVICGPIMEATITIPGAPGSTIWFWVGPTVFDGEGEYDYALWTNLDVPVATRARDWGSVKRMFD